MNTQVFQSIKLMELPVMELREKIEEMVESNPALEVLDDPSSVSLDEAVESSIKENDYKEEDDYFASASDSGYNQKSGAEASDAKLRFIEGALSHPQTLQEHLLWQLRLEPIDAELREICEILIQNLGDDGFHEEAPETLFKTLPPRLGEAIRLVQTLDPQGTCTADYHESLKVQVSLLPDAEPGIAQALDYLDLLEREKFAEVAKKIDCTEKKVRQYLEEIKHLSPFPGRRYAPMNVRYVIPDVQVVKKDGDFAIILNDEEIPVLGISPFFLKIAESGKKGDKPTRNFARENVKEARWFIASINLRNHTLLRVTRALLEFQRSFFTNGPKYLAPLTLHDIADELGVHETTVSRTANGKFIQTEWGIFELRYFFSNSISGQGSSGSQFSKKGVKEIIKEIIEGGSRHYSDHELTDMLAQQGIQIARRTVSKYRAELGLGSSYSR